MCRQCIVWFLLASYRLPPADFLTRSLIPHWEQDLKKKKKKAASKEILKDLVSLTSRTLDQSLMVKQLRADEMFWVIESVWLLKHQCPLGQVEPSLLPLSLVRNYKDKKTSGKHRELNIFSSLVEICLILTVLLRWCLYDQEINHYTGIVFMSHWVINTR